jgi:toxin ParE1/3/4
VGEIEAAFESVRYFPHAAPARDQLAPGLRVTFHGAYAIYYQARPDEIVIIRVLRGARDVTAIAEHGGFKE